jgi:hypothetical protein
MSHTIDGSGNPHSFRDIHGEMDGKLIKYPIKTRFSVPDRQKLIYALIEVMKNRGNSEIKDYGIQGLEIIARDAGTPANWQGADQLFVDDVLAEICALLVNVKEEAIVDTIINHLGEQMSDMIKSNGFCASGRLRVFQCYMILRDYFDGTHLSSSN